MDASASPAFSADTSELSLFGLGIGSTLTGKYVVESVIGSGGMSVVVRALHTLLGQPVALKLLRPELANDPIHVERFLREALAAAQLKNEHVVRVLDADRLPGGAPYLVMEALEGLDLAQLLLARGPLGVSDVVYYVLQTCEAVAEAHARGIVHRDLKPSNLFLTTTVDGGPCVKVLDFGISKLEASVDLRLTGTMVVLGSPLHMSPEQIRDSRTVDRRTDIWSLGTVLFELLTGRPPFLAETPAALIARISSDRPESLAALRPDVPAALESVLLRCLEKDREARVQSVEELVRLLSPFAPNEAWTHIERSLRFSEAAPWPPRAGDTLRISDLAPEATAPLDDEAAEPGVPVGISTRRVDRTGVPGLAPVAPSFTPLPPRAPETTSGPAESVVGWGTTQRPAPSPARRGRRALAVAAGAVVLGALGAAGLWWLERAPGADARPASPTIDVTRVEESAVEAEAPEAEPAPPGMSAAPSTIASEAPASAPAESAAPRAVAPARRPASRARTPSRKMFEERK